MVASVACDFFPLYFQIEKLLPYNLRTNVKFAYNFRTLCIEATFYKKRLLKISDESNASTSPSLFDRPIKDETKRPPKTFETSIVPLGNPNR